MALTGRTVQSSYLDLVQLEKSGAGLPSHAGKEAAVYDGSGAQILGRTAVRHWLDPDPDAIAGTWEFSTYGDANQAALEAAGWTFSDCTASVTGGCLKIVSTGSNNVRAYTTVSLSGDFDYVTKIWGYPKSPAAQFDWIFGFMVGIPAPTDVGHNCLQTYSDTGPILNYTIGDTFDDNGFGGGGTATARIIPSTGVFRLARYSGTVCATCAADLNVTWTLGTSSTTGQVWKGGSGADASTFTRLTYMFDATTAGQSFLIPFLRRYK